ncbi:MAG: glycoside hydrolase family 13 protein [Calditrichaceae bacterium]
MINKLLIWIAVAIFFAPSCQDKIVDKIPKNVPAWSKEAIWYQIFPERFRNGDTNNDPTLEDMSGAWPYYQSDKWQIHPWTSDWYKLQPWEKANGHDFYWNHGLRRYGGDLQGILDRLDYLQELGITAIYFNPLFESPSLHKYDATMYHHIDNNFGPDPDGDRKIWNKENPADPSTWRWTSADLLFLKLIKECHKRNIHVIIDGVFNHVGYTFWAFQDVLKNQQNSKFKNWFIIKRWDDPSTDSSEFEYQGWNGITDLPEIHEDENGLVAGPKSHIHEIVKRWMDPNGDGDPSDGIDGWRLDVAEKISIKFWKYFRKWVKKINPDAYITGEIWWENWPKNKIFNAAPWLQGDVFDAVMNYRFTRAVRQFVANRQNQITARAFADSIQAVQNDYRKDNFYALMNLMDSHDMERVASQIINPDHWIDHGGNPAQNPDFDVRKPNAVEIQKQKLIAGIQMTMPGAPMIYYGDEAGMWGGDDPDCRKPMVWPTLKYEPETTHPFGKKRPKDKVSFNRDLFNWYKKCISIRQQEKSLSIGDLRFIEHKNPKLLIYKRTLDNSSIWIVINNSPKNVIVDQDLAINGKDITELLSNRKLTVTDLKSLQLGSFEMMIIKADINS